MVPKYVHIFYYFGNGGAENLIVSKNVHILLCRRICA
jgi:hypothetical protein